MTVKKIYTLDELQGYSIHTIRDLYRTNFNGAPGQKSKQTLIDEILLVQNGEGIVERSNRGRKPLAVKDSYTEQGEKISQPITNGTKCCGVLEIVPDGYGFLRTDNYEISSRQDVFVTKTIIKQFGLRNGDYIVGKCQVVRENESPALQQIITVNDKKTNGYRKRPYFDDLVPCYPDEKLKLETSNSQDLSIRSIDLLSPIGKGQRGLIVAPPKTGKTTILKKIATSLEENYPNVKLLVLLLDERPEEVTDIRESINGEIVYSTFDEEPSHHIRIAELVIQRAKRLVEEGEDVVILLDSITKLARAYNVTCPSSGKTLTGGVDPLALTSPKKFFGSARNIRGGGSLTILATALIETGSRMDEVIYEEFKGTGNMEIILSRNLSERRVFPAIDLYRSGTRKEELLLSEKELEVCYKLRKLLQEDYRSAESFLTMLAKSKNNLEFIEKFDEWVKLAKIDN